MIELSDRDKVLLSYIRDNRGNPGLGDEIERLIIQSYRDWRLWKRIVLNSDPNDQRHGTDNAYHYGCRCDRCMEAHRQCNADHRKHNGNSSGKKRPVIRSDGKTYESAAAAARDMHCERSNIGNVCRGIGKTACGYGWRFDD